jgi:hypothetical protein
VTDTLKNGIVGTLSAWSMTVTPLVEGAASQSQSLAAADLFYLGLGLSSEEDDRDESPLDLTQEDYWLYDLLP